MTCYLFGKILSIKGEFLVTFTFNLEVSLMPQMRIRSQQEIIKSLNNLKFIHGTVMIYFMMESTLSVMKYRKEYSLTSLIHRRSLTPPRYFKFGLVKIILLLSLKEGRFTLGDLAQEEDSDLAIPKTD